MTFTYRNKNFYILPSCSITSIVVRVTDITAYESTLCYKGKLKMIVPLKDTIATAIEFLQQHKTEVAWLPITERPLTLHIWSVQRNQLVWWIDWPSVVVSFMDSLLLLRYVYINRNSYSQQSLCSDPLDTEYNAPNALFCWLSLRNLIKFTLKGNDISELEACATK